LTIIEVIRMMLIRMTGIGTQIAALLAAGAVAVAGVAHAGAGAEGAKAPAQRAALVVDAATGRDGRDLVDDRLAAAGAPLRLPRTPEEARTNVRYFAAQGYRVVVAGPASRAAARATQVPAIAAGGVPAAVALAAAGR
jgi:hypothetical protein